MQGHHYILKERNGAKRKGRHKPAHTISYTATEQPDHPSSSKYVLAISRQ